MSIDYTIILIDNEEVAHVGALKGIYFQTICGGRFHVTGIGKSYSAVGTFNVVNNYLHCKPKGETVNWCRHCGLNGLTEVFK